MVAVRPHFPVQVRASGQTGVANCANHFTGLHRLAGLHQNAGLVPVSCEDTPAMVKNGGTTTDLKLVRERNHTTGRSPNRRAGGCAKINATVRHPVQTSLG